MRFFRPLKLCISFSFVFRILFLIRIPLVFRIYIPPFLHGCCSTVQGLLDWFEVDFDRKKPPPGGVPIYYVPSSRTVCKRTPLEGFVPGSSRGVLLHTVLDEGTW